MQRGLLEQHILVSCCRCCVVCALRDAFGLRFCGLCTRVMKLVDSGAADDGQDDGLHADTYIFVFSRNSNTAPDDIIKQRTMTPAKPTFSYSMHPHRAPKPDHRRQPEYSCRQRYPRSGTGARRTGATLALLILPPARLIQYPASSRCSRV